MLLIISLLIKIGMENQDYTEQNIKNLVGIGNKTK